MAKKHFYLKKILGKYSVAYFFNANKRRGILYRLGEKQRIDRIGWNEREFYLVLYLLFDSLELFVCSR